MTQYIFFGGATFIQEKYVLEICFAIISPKQKRWNKLSPYTGVRCWYKAQFFYSTNEHSFLSSTLKSQPLQTSKTLGKDYLPL